MSLEVYFFELSQATSCYNLNPKVRVLKPVVLSGSSETLEGWSPVGESEATGGWTQASI